MARPKSPMTDAQKKAAKREYNRQYNERKRAEKLNGSARSRSPRQTERIVLQEVYTEADGRILLKDQHGRWWGAKLLDF